MTTVCEDKRTTSGKPLSTNDIAVANYHQQIRLLTKEASIKIQNSNSLIAKAKR